MGKQLAKSPAAVIRVFQDILRSRMGAMMGQSHGGKRNLYEVFGYPVEVTSEEMTAIYLRNDIANRIISAFPSATWREVPVIRDEAGDSSDQKADSYSPFVEAVEDFFDKHRCFHYLTRGDKLSSLGRYGVILLGFKDGKNLSEPLESKNAPLLFIQPYGETQTKINTWETDPKNERFGRPKTYTLQQGGITGQANVQSTTLNVHWTRVIHLAENLDANDTYGVPRLLPIYNRLKDLEKVMGGGAESFWLNARPGTALQMDKDAAIDEAILKDMKEQAEEFEHQLRRMMTVQGVTVQSLSAPFTDPSPLIDKLLDLIAGSVGIPKRILVGSERGELSSEQDENNWAARIDERRADFATPAIIQPFVTRLIATGNLPKPEGAWWCEWPEGTALGPEAQARIGQTRAATLASYLSVPGAELIVPMQEFRTDFLGLTPESEYEDPILLEEPLPEDDDAPPVEEPVDDGDVLATNYDEDQPRDDDGQFGSGGGGSSGGGDSGGGGSKAVSDSIKSKVPGAKSVTTTFDEDSEVWSATVDGTKYESAVGSDDDDFTFRKVGKGKGPKTIKIPFPDANVKTNATTPRTLYVRRQVLNAKDIVKWAKKQGFKTTLPASDMHVTIAYSKAPVDWVKIGAEYTQRKQDGSPIINLIIPEGGPRVLEEFGRGECVVLAFSSSELHWRHEWIKNCGATWDFPDYTPHITLTYKKGELDLGGVDPYQGEIELGPEIWEEVNPKWSDGIVENARADEVIHKRARGAGHGKRANKTRHNGNRGGTRKAGSHKRANRNALGK